MFTNKFLIVGVQATHINASTGSVVFEHYELIAFQLLDFYYVGDTPNYIIATNHQLLDSDFCQITGVVGLITEAEVTVTSPVDLETDIYIDTTYILLGISDEQYLQEYMPDDDDSFEMSIIT